MVGHVGTTELAASSFAGSVFMIGMYFGMGLTYGITPLIGKAFSKGILKDVVILLKNGIFTHFIAAIVLTSLMFGVYFILPYFGQPPEVMKEAQPFYLLLCLSYLPFMLFFSLKQFFEGLGNTKMAMQITLAANVVNVVVNYVLIFGKLGFPKLGLIGAGVGTVISRFVMVILFAFYIRKLPRYRRYFFLANKSVFNIDKIITILKIGIPIGFQIIVEVIAFAIGAVMMGWLGEKELAAHQVAIGLASFTYMISLGISQANTIRVSHQMGLKDYRSLRMASAASTHLVLMFMLTMGIVFILARSYLPLLFTVDTSVINIAAGLLIVAAVFQVFDGLQVVMLSTLRGIADVKKPMYIAVFAYLFIGIPTSYILSFVFSVGPQGIWVGYLAGLGSAGILFFFRFRYVFQKMTKKGLSLN